MATLKSAREASTPQKPSTAKLEAEVAALRRELDALAKKCADLERKCSASGGSVDTSNFVSKHEFSLFKGQVSKKVGLKR